MPLQAPTLNILKDPQQHSRYLAGLVQEINAARQKALEAHALVASLPAPSNIAQWLNTNGQAALASLGVDQPTGVAKSIRVATTPTVDDDQTKGYGYHSQWIDTSSNALYICTNPAPGAAVWKLLS